MLLMDIFICHINWDISIWTISCIMNIEDTAAFNSVKFKIRPTHEFCSKSVDSVLFELSLKVFELPCFGVLCWVFQRSLMLKSWESGRLLTSSLF